MMIENIGFVTNSQAAVASNNKRESLSLDDLVRQSFYYHNEEGQHHHHQQQEEEEEYSNSWAIKVIPLDDETSTAGISSNCECCHHHNRKSSHSRSHSQLDMSLCASIQCVIEQLHRSAGELSTPPTFHRTYSTDSVTSSLTHSNQQRHHTTDEGSNTTSTTTTKRTKQQQQQQQQRRSHHRRERNQGLTSRDFDVLVLSQMDMTV